MTTSIDRQAMARQQLRQVLLSGARSGDCTYTPKGDAPRSVRAHTRPVRTMDEGSGGLTARVELIVKLLRDESDELGGVAAPREGDQLERSGDSRRFVYSGEVLEELPHSWTLRFIEVKPLQMGTQHRAMGR